MDLEWRVAPDSPRNDVVYSGAVTGPTADDCAVFGPELLGDLMLAPEGMVFVFHHAPSDLKHLAWAGFPLHEKYKFHDTLILSHLLQENGEHGLGYLTKEYFGDNYKAEFKAKYRLPEDAPKSENDIYNAKDVHFTLQLLSVLRRGLEQDGVPEGLVEHVHSLQKSLLNTEINGIAIDRPYLMERGIELKTRLTEIAPKLREAAATEIEEIELDLWVKEIDKYKTPARRARVERPSINYDSPKQLMTLLYDRLKLPVQMGKPKKDKNTGRNKPPGPSTDDDALEALSELHPFPAILRKYREDQKVYGTYIEGTLERMVEGRIYPSFNVAGTATGRISHSNPNMGNMPRDGGIRGMFVPDPGHVFISADFSQLEVCLSAHFTRDANLLRIVNEGASQHDITAASLGIARGLAKTVNFGMAYGCSHFKVAKVLGVSNEKGKEAYDKYWETYSGQKKVMDDCAARVDRGEPIVSPYGRRRRFEVRKRPAWDSAYRQAWNALVQGTGSDCTSRAFYLADRRLRHHGIGRALFTIHDEILCQVKKEHWEEAQKILVDTMQSVGNEIALTIQLKAEPSGACERWLD